MTTTAPTAAAADPESRNPYIGPRAFQTGETLYGRDAEARRVINLLLSERIVLLHSPSGAGKTSLLQAKIAVEMREEFAFDVLPVVNVGRPLPPESQRQPGFNRYIYSAVNSICSDPARGDLARWAESGMRLSDLLPSIRREYPNTSRVNPQLLIFDQFEELMTLNSSDVGTKADFLADVAEVLEDDRCWAIFAIRDEYVALLQPYTEYFPTGLATRFRLELLDESRALEAVQEPALEAGAAFTTSQAELVVTALRSVEAVDPAGKSKVVHTRMYVEPVQLQVVCLRLWEESQQRWKSKKAPRRAIHVDGQRIRKLVDNALGAFFDEAVARVAEGDTQVEQEIRDWIEEHLITSSRLRGHVFEEALPSTGMTVEQVGKLVVALVLRRETHGDRTWYELTHDRMIEPIVAANLTWNNAHARLLRQLAEAWKRAGKDEAFLLAPDTLDRFEPVSGKEKLSRYEKLFLEKSREHAERLRNRKRVLMLIFGGAVAVLVVLVAMSVLLIQQTRIAAERAADAALLTEKSKRLQILADQYDTLAIEVFDLQQELAFRQAGAAIPTLGDLKAIVEGRENEFELMRPVPAAIAPPADTATARVEFEQVPFEAARAELILRYEGDLANNVAALQRLRRVGFLPVWSGRVSADSTNALLFGEGVSRTDVRAVAFSLLASGVHLKRVRFSSVPEMSGKIELAYVRHLSDWPTLPVETIRRFETVRN